MGSLSPLPMRHGIADTATNGMSAMIHKKDLIVRDPHVDRDGGASRNGDDARPSIPR